MIRRLTLITAVLLALSGVASAQDELTAGEKLAIESIIKQFSLRSFAARQKATERLIEMGPKVVPVVQKSLAETNDNEVKLRCRMVLEGVSKKYGVRIDTRGDKPVTPAGGLDFKPARVTLNLKDAELDEILQEFADKSGNKLIRMPKNWEGKPIDFAVTNMLYWQALDKLCEQTKLMYRPDWGPMRGRGARRPPGLGLAPAAVDKPDIGGYAGPFVLKVASATKHQRFRTTSGTYQREGLSYAIRYFWEDRLKALKKEVSFAKVVADDGQELAISNRGRMGMTGWGTGRSVSGSITLTLAEVPRALDKIARIEGTVKVTLGAGKNELRIEDVFGDGEKEVDDGAAVIKVTKTRRGNTRMAAAGRGYATITLVRTQNGKTVSLESYRGSDDYGFSLIDPDGGRHKGSAYTYGTYNVKPAPQKKVEAPLPRKPAVVKGEVEATLIGAARGTARGYVVGNNVKKGKHEVIVVPPAAAKAGAADKAPVVARRVGSGSAYAYFSNLPDIEGKWTLVYTRPTNTAVQEFPFTIKDVPVP